MAFEFEVAVLAGIFLLFAIITKDLDLSLAIAGFISVIASLLWLDNNTLTIIGAIALAIGVLFHLKH